MIHSICIAGAGTMGNGIAQLAAQSGYKTLLFDVNKEVLQRAALTIKRNLQGLVDKQKITTESSTVIFQRIHFITDARECIADIIIEAIIENISAKTELFNLLALLNAPGTLLATNTSSLSVSAIQAGILYPERVVGMHFFNPAPVMKLVEVVKGNLTNDSSAEKIMELATSLGKTPVLCKDAPGFIVNRVARHYYLEAMKLVESGMATMENVDIVMESCGFKMGPFKLMDLIGIDVNLAVTKSIYDAFDQEERFKPSAIQEQKVAGGELGKKTGKGFYKYE